MNITKREKTLIIVLILAIFCAYFIYYLKPHLSEMNNLAAEKSNKEVLISASSQQQLMINNLDAEIADKERQIEKYSQGITLGFDQPAVIVYLEQTISQYAQKIMFIFNDPIRMGQMEVCTIKVTMITSLENLKQLLNKLSDDKYFIKVTSLNALRSSTEQPANTPVPADNPAEVSDTAPAKNLLDITMTLELFNIPEELPLDTEHTSDDLL